MIFIRHEAPHLFREDAFSEYCWSVDAWGAHQPMSFIFLSYEKFKDLCGYHGLALFVPIEDKPAVHLPHKQHFPPKFDRERPVAPVCSYGLITRINDSKEIEKINANLAKGNNVLALLPNEAINIWYQDDIKRISQAIEAATALNINNAERKITTKLTNRDEVSWEEIPTTTNGRLFVVRDAFISDAYFMDDYGSTPENDQKIQRLVYELAKFKKPLIRCEVRNSITSWPAQEPLNIVIDLYNHGDTLSNVELSVSIDDSFEPLSPTERVFPVLKTLTRASFVLEVLPQSDGLFSSPINVIAKYQKEEIPVITDPRWTIEILPGHAGAYRDFTKKDDPSFSGLMSVTTKESILQDIRLIIDLARVDAQACLNRMRSLAERLSYQILEKYKISLPQKTFAIAIQEIQKRKVLSNRVVGYLHTVRVIGNLASHSSGEKLTDVDVRITAYALAAVIEELLERKIL